MQREARARSRLESSPEQLYRALLVSPGADDTLEELLSLAQKQPGSLDVLVERLRSARAARPHDAAPRQALARVLMALGRGDEALAELAQAAVEARPAESSTLLRVRLLRELGRHEEAAAQLQRLGRAARARAAAVGFLREAAREQLAAGLPEQALTTVQEARGLGGAAFAAELRALEHAALRQAGRHAALAEQLERERAYREAAEVWREQGEAARALAALRAALRQAPDALATRAQLVLALESGGQLDAAQREARELVRRAPHEPSYLQRWAELVRVLQGRDQALAQLAGLAAGAPRSRALHRALLGLYQHWQEPELVQRELSVLSALEPGEPAHRRALAEQALARGDRALALRLLERSSASAAEDAELARVLAERDYVPEAVQRAERAVARAPGVWAYRRLLASLLERAGRTLDAERVLSELVQDTTAPGPLRGEAREQLVGLWRRTRSDRLHAAELEAKLRADPRDQHALRLLILLSAPSPEGRTQRLALLRQLLVLEPTDREALLWLERAQREARDTTAALETRTRLLETASAQPEHALGALELALRDPLDAAVPALLARALGLSPRDAHVQRLAGDVLTQRGELAAAGAAYERAVGLDEHDYAARLAWADNARARGQGELAQRQLVAVLSDASEESLVREAARALLHDDEARAEAVLLRPAREAVLDDANSTARGNVLLSLYARRVLPLASRVLAGSATDAERAEVEARVQRALAVLLHTLVRDAGPERTTALTLLAAAAPAQAVAPLLALAERADAAPSERALALTGVGSARDVAAGPRLRVLYTQVGRALRPAVLWALSVCAPKEVARLLPEAAHDRDPSVRGLAALLQEPVPARVVSWDELFAESADARALAASQLLHPARPAAPLPAPPWPFELAAYRAQVARARVDTHAAPALAASDWAALVALTRRRLESPELAAATVAALSSHAAGLLPTALRSQWQGERVCLSAARAAELATATRPALLALLAASALSVRLAAQDLLLRSGGADDPALLRVLEQEGGVELSALLRTAASLSPLPAALRPGLRRLRAGARDWPTRLWAARALREGAAALADEPVELVRVATSLRAPRPEGPASATCSPLEPVAN
jgi:predicted Zn-dependent protease